MKLVVIRHGQTDWNVSRKIQGNLDIPLNDTGRREAEGAASQLPPYDIGLIYTSPLKRTFETARIIASRLKADVIADSRLTERNFGGLQGKTWEAADFPALCDWGKNITPLNGESYQDVFKRVSDFLSDITERHDNINILVVVHGHFLKLIERYFNDSQQPQDSGITYNCDIIQYEFTKGTAGNA